MQGVETPCPQTCREKLLLSKKKPKYPIEFKKEVCEHAKDESIISASLVYNVDRNTISRWIKKYDQFGIDGFITKRNDTQKKKLDDATLRKIIRYKKNNPKITYSELREQFNLKCSNSLISRKLKKFQPKKQKNINRNCLYLLLKTVHHDGVEKYNKSLYQFTIYSSLGKIVFLGFSRRKDSISICLFIRKGLDFLKTIFKYKNVSKIITKINFLVQHEYNKIVKSSHNVTLKILNNVKNNKLLQIICDYNSKDIEGVMFESYNNYFNNINSSVLKNMLITPHINIDKLKYIEEGSVEWDSYTLPYETKETLYKVLNDIEKSGDKVATDFNDAEAKDLYEKVYTALISLRDSNKELQIELLLKKAKLFFHSGQYQVALMLYRDITRFAKENNFKKELGSAYYLLGIIYSVYHNKKGGLRYFKKSKNVLEGLVSKECKCYYYRTVVRKNLWVRDFTRTIKLNKLYYRYAKEINNKELVGNSLNIDGVIFYYQEKYKKSEKAFTKAKEYYINSGNMHGACYSLSTLLNIYSYVFEKKYSTLEVLLNELKMISNKINKPFVSFEVNYKLGIFYYNKSKYDIAEKLLYQSLPGNKKFSYKELYLSNLYYLGRVLHITGKSGSAVRFLNLLIEEARNMGNSLYVLYSHRILAKIFYERKDYNRSLSELNKIIKFSKKLNKFYITADSHKFIGNICLNKGYNEKAKYHFEESLDYFNLFSEENMNFDILNDIEYVKTKLSKV